uniref:Uncharacterized protein n=1 Tax=Rhizophora mucronata TaxID=61149 RepID=A0A2P2N5M9_RHIMU
MAAPMARISVTSTYLSHRLHTLPKKMSPTTTVLQVHPSSLSSFSCS